MPPSLIYLRFDDVIEAHASMLRVSGGLPGIRDAGQLESILFHVQNDDYYPTISHKASHVYYAICKGHCFNDGNKRTALVATAQFFSLNGYDYIADEFIVKMENVVVAVADNRINKELLHKIIVSMIAMEDDSEELKLAIYEAMAGVMET
ncbi:death-on-curing family protein [Rhodomicrobium vannielii ATCC 17100]|uniref:Death-on-curing family protein n=1 Tax=Rhodomicrobium vannielii (strain ATCC 17100 / DSM 162 / LMG 4299 / NCIMB 10020 / ATH 3.1.1) TaxID=648757 RepID=E3I8I3_RHOVT|nr:type II toxin-antitoxin system death-on-curing family toxin [Rhodomicrobium vannielii]ADP70892.1 death-on-curing family protein [Rhodomicrobium vannielii ATCC 17100]